MILNPPNIVELLTTYREVERSARGAITPVMLSMLIDRHLGRLEWGEFKRTYQLYLQSIPFAAAREAWGINAAGKPTTQLP